MKKKIILVFSLLFILNALFINSVLAVDSATPCTGATSNSSDCIRNPLQGQGTNTLMGLLNSIINKIVIPIGGVVIAFMIIYTGFKFVTAQGKPAELQQARMMFLYVVIGAAILLGAWGISQMICGTINQISGGGLCG